MSKTIQLKGDNTKVNVLPYTFFILLFGSITALVEFAIHIGDPDPSFAYQNILFIAFNSTFFILMLFRQTRFVDEKFFGGWTRLLIQVVITTSAIFAIQIIVGFFIRVKYAITPLEIYLFYINAGISEEFFYRVFLIHAPRSLLMFFGAFSKFIKKESTRRLIINWILIIATSLIFMLSHLGVYGDIPLMLLSTFIAGMIFASSFVFYKNIFPSLVAHVLNNAISAGVIIQSSSIMGPAIQVYYPLLSICLTIVIFIITLMVTKKLEKNTDNLKTDILLNEKDNDNEGNLNDIGETKKNNNKMFVIFIISLVIIIITLIIASFTGWIDILTPVVCPGGTCP